MEADIFIVGSSLLESLNPSIFLCQVNLSYKFTSENNVRG